jgi:hypothetical protein
MLMKESSHTHTHRQVMVEICILKMVPDGCD